MTPCPGPPRSGPGTSVLHRGPRAQAGAPRFLRVRLPPKQSPSPERINRTLPSPPSRSGRHPAFCCVVRFSSHNAPFLSPPPRYTWRSVLIRGENSSPPQRQEEKKIPGAGSLNRRSLMTSAISGDDLSGEFIRLISVGRWRNLLPEN